MPANKVTSRTPWHIVFVLDDSGSMSVPPTKPPASDVNTAMTAMIAELKVLTQGKKPFFKLSIIKFGSRPELICEAVSEQAVDMTRVAGLDGSSGGTDAAAALIEALAVLRKNPGAETDFVPYVFFLSDGAPDDAEKALAAGTNIKNLSIAAGTPFLVTIGFGDANDGFMEELASKRELYKRLSDPKQLVKFLPQVGTTLAQTTSGAEGVNKSIINI